MGLLEYMIVDSLNMFGEEVNGSVYLFPSQFMENHLNRHPNIYKKKTFKRYEKND